MAAASRWPLTIFSNRVLGFFLFGILNEGNPWPQDNIGGILFLLPLQVAVFRPSSGRLGSDAHAHAHAQTARLLLLSRTSQSFRFHFHHAAVPFPRPRRSSQRGVPSQQ